MHFFEADGLPSKHLAEIDLFVPQTDAAAVRDHDGFVVEGIVDVGQSGVGTRGRLVDLGRAFHVQSFVRAFVVEDLDKVIEAGLLLQEVGGGRLGSFFLQSEMHAFVSAILLGMTRLDAFDTNAEAKPPDGEFAEVEQSVRRSEGHTVITANVGGQAALAKKPFKYGKSILLPSRGKRLTGEQKTAGVVGDLSFAKILARREINSLHTFPYPPICWMKRARQDPGLARRWQAFLRNHREVSTAMDFFTVPTATFNLLYCFFIISHDRRQIVHFNVTQHPTSSWIVQQLREAFPYQSAPKFLLFDHDQKYGLEITRCASLARASRSLTHANVSQSARASAS